MQPSQQQQSRINLSDLKAQLVKKLGPERSKRYFYYLNRLLSQKLSKAEFDKLCFWTLGRENLPLHNQLIRSILRNACHAKVPPPVHEKEAPTKSTTKVGKKSPPLEDGYQQTGPSPSLTQGPPLFWSNGDVLPISPRKSRSGIRERRPRDRADRPSPLGPNGKTEFTSHQSTAAEDGNVKVITENGDLNSCDIQRLVHNNHQGLAEQPENELDASLQRSTKRPRTKKSPEDELVPVHSKGPVELVLVEDGEEVEQAENSNSTTRSPLSAPLGIPFCSASVGGARRSLPTISSSSYGGSFDSGGLPDTETLRKRMEQIAGAQGLEGISTDCANLLNNGLDAYLKRLIRSCFELVGARSGHESTKTPAYKQQPHGKLINGMWPGQQLQMQSSGGPMEGMQEFRTHCPVSLLDFKVAMELNPQQLGEDWPLLLEKICLHAYDE
ncbi:Transcriptional coactivator Hfi1/Transcriptional adapter 1 [Macleaya cordata]|uniref:Transcriptional coactivator Hfi1/Transcriptional adapter 1 n=1 Tax=Macleaya cordata TaxID=56857 RepID=A0A200PRT7_MACCD|nr:Transcriptional coactivator Hfi1/Transcriptional adapter 1 [Macleaya cordata]